MTTFSGLPQPIGAGPVATVYSGLQDGVPAAMKVFPAKFDRRTLTAFERERTRLASVAEGSSILPVRSVELLADGRHALWMELCAQSLATLVRQAGMLGPADVVVLGNALARALAAAHSAGVVHGGVNPNNVLFRASGEPVLADFGVVLRQAFARDPLHAIEFQAPETAREQTLDERTDLYGLGAVLHFALTGQAPHPGRLGEQPGERVLRVLRSPIPAIHRAGVPVELSTVVARMLAVDPAHRPRDAAAVADQLAAMLPQSHQEDPPDQSTVDIADLAPPQRERRRPLIIAGAVLLAVLATIVVLVSRHQPEELTTTPQTPPAPPPSTTAEPASTVAIELAEPTDLGDQVVLNWTAPVPNLDFVVVIAPDGEPKQTQLAGRTNTRTIPVDASRKYCFQVKATDKLRIYESQPKAVRGADCQV